MPDANYKHLESFVKLGTHFEPRRGEMSHTCDISLVRVNDSFELKIAINDNKQLSVRLLLNFKECP